MTTLVAKQAARIALEWRSLETRAAVIRGRVEALPGAYQASPMAAAENQIALRLMDKAKKSLDAIDAALERHEQALAAEEMGRAAQKQAELLAERGVETFQAGSVQVRDGWAWLTTRKPPRLHPDEVVAGNTYATLFSRAMQDSMSVGSNDNGPGGEDGTDRLDAAIKNRQQLETVRAHILGAVGSGHLVGLLDAVCGRGETLRNIAGGDDRRAMVLEAEIRIALQMAGVAIKMMRETEKRLAA